jgi:host factor-I protein
MPPKATRHLSKAATPLVTGQEALYLRFLSDKQVPVNVKLRDGEVVHGWIEYYDDSMIRLTREGKPNLFIYKQQIRTISELVRRDQARRRTALRTALRKEVADGAGQEPAAGEEPNGHGQPDEQPAPGEQAR